MDAIIKVIDDAKGVEILAIDLAGKTALADAMIIASGTSDRHVGAIAERILGSLRDMRKRTPRVEGMPVCDWVLIDTGDIIIHLFRPEVRGFYNLEKLWGMGRPLEGAPEETIIVKPEATEKPKRAPRIKADSATTQPAARKPVVRRPRKTVE